MIVVEDYRQHRIEVVASAAAGGRSNAEVRIRRTLSEAKPHVETVTCLKLSPAWAEQAGQTWAKRWLDVNGGARWPRTTRPANAAVGKPQPRTRVTYAPYADSRRCGTT